MTTSLEILVNVSIEEQLQRKTICESCEHYMSGIHTANIIDAETGFLQTVEINKIESCKIDSHVNIGYIKLKSAVCPESKW